MPKTTKATKTAPASEPPPLVVSLTPYEASVQENIRRNMAVMQSLGLGRTDACKHDEIRRNSEPKAKRSKTTDAASTDEHREAVRRSQRLMALAAAPAAADELVSEEVACDGEHSAAKEDHLRWAGVQRGVSIVGSASYEHTLHRVMTMSEAQLERRMGVIERACGQHAVAKMRLFASVLALEGYASLAEEAAAAYQRLVQKLGLPEGVGDGNGEDGAADD